MEFKLFQTVKFQAKTNEYRQGVIMKLCPPLSPVRAVIFEVGTDRKRLISLDKLAEMQNK